MALVGVGMIYLADFVRNSFRNTYIMKLIPKYQNERFSNKAGLIPMLLNLLFLQSLIKRTYTPTQSYVSQDNRSEWQKRAR